MTSNLSGTVLLSALTIYLIGISFDGQAQQSRVMAGTLTCNGNGTVGLILGSRQRLTCRFNPAGNAPVQHYSARLTRIGLDIGVQGQSVLVWTVLGASPALPAGSLAGRFAGVGANASVGVGLGANALVGGSGNSVVLQPLSVQAQSGVNVAAGVAGIKLTYVRP